MRKFSVLLKVQFLSYFGVNKILSSKKYKVSGTVGIILLLVLLGALIGGIGYVYSLSIAQVLLVAEGNVKGLIPLMVAVAAVACLVFSFYSTGSVLYGFKDYDTLSAMPIKTSTVVLGKLAFTYIADLFFGFLIVIPSVIVYADFNGGVEFLTLIRLFCMTLFLPMFSTVISVVLGVLGTVISSRFKHRNVVQLLFMFVVFMGFYALSFLSSIENGGAFVFIEKAFFLSPWVKEGLYDWLYVLLFCGVCLASAAAVTVFVCATYKKINTLVTSVKRSADFKMRVYGGKSQFKALLIKEIKKLFSSATYALNTLMGPVMCVLFTVVIVVMCAQDANLKLLIPLIGPSIYAFTLLISPTTVCSVSVEGSTFWIMRTAPVKANALLNAKLMTNGIFAVIPALVSGITVAALLFGVSVINGLLVLAIAVITAILGGNLGLLFNLLFPMMKWDSVNKAVKQGVSTIFTVLSAMIFAIAEGVILYFSTPDFTLALSLIAGALLIFTVCSFCLLYRYGERLIIKKT